jgi:predicted phage-related endonuclease
VQLSPAALREIALTGRVAQDAQAGTISSELAAQLNGQTSEIQMQIATDKQANGGTLTSSEAQTIQQLQNQVSQTIYSDAHNGAAAPTNPDVTKAGAREAVQAGRIALNETAGNLSSAQATQLSSQLGTIQQQIASEEQANGGSLSTADAKAINQAQNQLSQQIYDTAHSASTPDSAA